MLSTAHVAAVGNKCRARIHTTARTNGVFRSLLRTVRCTPHGWQVGETKRGDFGALFTPFLAVAHAGKRVRRTVGRLSVFFTPTGKFHTPICLTSFNIEVLHTLTPMKRACQRHIIRPIPVLCPTFTPPGRTLTPTRYGR